MTKYAKEIISAQKDIKAAGALCTWYKLGSTAGPTPEFPEYNSEGVAYPVYIVFYPSNRVNLLSEAIEALSGQPRYNLYGLIAGGLPFVPAIDDRVVTPSGKDIRVASLNLTAPDDVMIVAEIGFS